MSNNGKLLSGEKSIFSFCGRERSTTQQRFIHFNPFEHTKLSARVYQFWDDAKSIPHSMSFGSICHMFWFYALIWCHWYGMNSQVHQIYIVFVCGFSFFSFPRHSVCAVQLCVHAHNNCVRINTLPKQIIYLEFCLFLYLFQKQFSRKKSSPIIIELY